MHTRSLNTTATFLALLTAGGAASAAELAPLYVAIPDGASPGIYRIQDNNRDGDALDRGEVVLWGKPGTGVAIDIALDTSGALYALTESGAVWRLEDRNGNGYAGGSSEVTRFRDSTADGLTLKSGLSIAVSDGWNPTTERNQVEVYVLDMARGATYRLVDRDGDGTAKGGGELSIVQTIEAATPFSASRMSADDQGRIFGAISHGQNFARLDDVNSDGGIVYGMDGTSGPRCMAKACGPSAWSEYKAVPLLIDGVNPLKQPFGVAMASDGVGYISDLQTPFVVRYEDLNFDEDGRDPKESSYYYLSGKETFYDLALLNDAVVVVGSVDSVAATTIALLEDLNSDKDARDAGERRTFARLPKGTPVALAVTPRRQVPQTLELIKGVDFAPLKGPKAVVLDGETTTITLRALNRDTGKPMPGARVGFAITAGCLELCPTDGDHADSQGYISFDVSRVPSPDPRATEAEGLKFSTFGDDLFLDVTGTSCDPYPTADAGPDQVVPMLAVVELEGDSGLGADAHFCWYQVDGPTQVTLTGECGTGVPSALFDAPDLEGDYSFELHTWNDCEVYDIDEVVVSVQ